VVKQATEEAEQRIRRIFRESGTARVLETRAVRVVCESKKKRV
jgi:hypothetical protein